MTQHDIHSYIETSREQGLSDTDIKRTLLEAGWTEDQVKPLFHSAPVPLPPPAPPKSGLKGGTTMWDAFQHVIMFISLYVYASSFGTLVHNFVDKWLEKTPSGYDGYGFSDFNDYIVRMATAALIVSFPIFAYLFITLHKKTIENPAFRAISARKKLIYITLVITFIIGIFEIGRTIYTLLGGNTTLNFLAHFVVNITIVGVIFGYYLNEVKEDRKHI